VTQSVVGRADRVERHDLQCNRVLRAAPRRVAAGRAGRSAARAAFGLCTEPFGLGTRPGALRERHNRGPPGRSSAGRGRPSRPLSRPRGLRPC
jgi:hypothetical protein